MLFESFQHHFGSLNDQRQSAKITYPLFDVLFSSLCAVIAGAQGWFDIHEYILGHHDWFKQQQMFLHEIGSKVWFNSLIIIIINLPPLPDTPN